MDWKLKLVADAPGRDGMKVAEKVAAAIRQLLDVDRLLLIVDAHERSITHQLAVHMRDSFKGWDVDCEYNRDGHDHPKRLEVNLHPTSVNCEATEGSLVFPDIIVHRRGRRDNYLVVEVKKSTSSRDCTYDREKLKAFASPPFSYRYALLVELCTGADATSEENSQCVKTTEWVTNPTNRKGTQPQAELGFYGAPATSALAWREPIMRTKKIVPFVVAVVCSFAAVAGCQKREAEEVLTQGVWASCTGDYDLAISCCTEAIRLDPKNAEAYRTRGSAYGRKGENDKAIGDYTEGIRLDPQNAMMYRARGSAYDGKGEYDKAIADYTEAVRLDPKNAGAYYARISAYLKKGDYDKAIADYAEAIRLDPRNAEAYCARGSFYLRVKGDYDKAIADYTNAIRLDPKNGEAYSERGSARAAKGEKGEAEADYAEAKRLGYNGR